MEVEATNLLHSRPDLADLLRAHMAGFGKNDDENVLSSDAVEKHFHAS